MVNFGAMMREVRTREGGVAATAAVCDRAASPTNLLRPTFITTTGSRALLGFQRRAEGIAVLNPIRVDGDYI